MLPAKYRLSDKKLFNFIFRNGKAVSSEALILKFLPDLEDRTKIGFSVGLKFSKKAFRRNKVKRWMRESAREVIEKIKPGSHILFIINSRYPYEKLSYDLIRAETEKLLKKAKILQ